MDPRLTPANEIVACSSLKGKIKHSNFIEGKNYQINVPFLDLLGTPDGKRNRQLIYGSKVKYFSTADGWAFIQNIYDRYVGYVRQNTIVSEKENTHIVTVPLAHIFLEPNIKSKNVEMLPLAAKISGEVVENGFLETELGWISVSQLKSKTELPKDPIEVSKLLENAPYLWGGNTSLGIDCSGLILFNPISRDWVKCFGFFKKTFFSNTIRWYSFIAGISKFHFILPCFFKR